MNGGAFRAGTIHDGWRVRQAGGVAPPVAFESPLPARVPGVVHHDLIEAGVIPHPDQGDGEERQRWVGQADWTWTRKLTAEDVPGPEDPAAVIELVFDSIDTVGTVGISGRVLGEVRNQFHPHRFRVDRAAFAGGRLDVALRSPLAELERRVDALGDRPVNADGAWGVYSYLRKAACSFGWDWGPLCPSLGLPGDVRVEVWRDSRIESVRPLVTTCDERLAVVDVQLDLVQDAATRGDGELEAIAQLRAPDGRVFEARIAPVERAGGVGGSTRLEIPNPARWWPRGRGGQPRHELRVELRRGDVVLDARTRRIGLRTSTLDNETDELGSRFRIEVNGESVFCQGANWIPDGLFPGTTPAARVKERIEQAAAAGFNMLRVWGGGVYESEVFYETCDELGIMVWQDFMFACATYPEEADFPESIAREARWQVSRLACHPSIVLWCGGNENVLAWRNWGWRERMDPERSWGRRYFTELLPKIVGELDPSRPFLPDSPWSGSVEADPNDPDRGDRHTWDLKLEAVREMVPRFVSEFGHQAPPARATIEEAIGETALASESVDALAAFESRQRGWGGDEAQYDRWLEEWFSPAGDLDQRLWRMRLLQARATRIAYEWLRLNRDRCGGALIWQLNDAWTGHSWSLIDVAGRPKPAWWAARAACRPRLLAFSVGERGLELGCVNEGRTPWTEEVRVRRIDFAGRDLAADRVRLDAPAFGVDRAAVGADLVLPSDPAGEVLVAETEQGRAFWFYGKDAWLSLPRPDLVFDVAATDRGHRIRATAETFIRDLHLDVSRIARGATADRGLDTLLPGDRIEFELRGTQGTSVAEVRKALESGRVVFSANTCGSNPA